MRSTHPALTAILRAGCATLALACRMAPAQEAPEKDDTHRLPQISPDARYDIDQEATAIFQDKPRFRSPYEGANSLPGRHAAAMTLTYTAFLGARLNKNVEVFLNPEIALGNGIGGGLGLGAFTNGDLIGQSSLRAEPYLSRYFVRWRVALPSLGEARIREVQVGRAPNLIGGTIPAHRLVLSAGKMAVSDFFDVNGYANNPRMQFMNNAFVNNLAFDKAGETRGYDLGAVAALVYPTWVLRAGLFAVPVVPGGPDLALDMKRAYSEEVEGELHFHLLKRKTGPAIVRVLLYSNTADAGGYAGALATAAGQQPDVTTVRRERTKRGFGLNFEQPLTEDNVTGVFARAGWNNGSSESSSYECDAAASLGAQIGGALWGRKEDRAGVALAQSELSRIHRDYLAGGGTGLAVGDGALAYRPERVFEGYYSYSLNKYVTATLDLQHITSPGYNRDRGPITIVSARLHYGF